MDYGLEGFYCEASTIEKTIASQEYLNPRGGSEQLPYYKNILEAYVGPSISSCSWAYLFLQTNSNEVGIMPF